MRLSGFTFRSLGAVALTYALGYITSNQKVLSLAVVPIHHADTISSFAKCLAIISKLLTLASYVKYEMGTSNKRPFTFVYTPPSHNVFLSSQLPNKSKRSNNGSATLATARKQFQWSSPQPRDFIASVFPLL